MENRKGFKGSLLEKMFVAAPGEEKAFFDALLTAYHEQNRTNNDMVADQIESLVEEFYQDLGVSSSESGKLAIVRIKFLREMHSVAEEISKKNTRWREIYEADEKLLDEAGMAAWEEEEHKEKDSKAEEVKKVEKTLVEQAIEEIEEIEAMERASSQKYHEEHDRRKEKINKAASALAAARDADASTLAATRDPWPSESRHAVSSPDKKNTIRFFSSINPKIAGAIASAGTGAAVGAGAAYGITTSLTQLAIYGVIGGSAGAALFGVALLGYLAHKAYKHATRKGPYVYYEDTEIRNKK